MTIKSPSSQLVEGYSAAIACPIFGNCLGLPLQLLMLEWFNHTIKLLSPRRQKKLLEALGSKLKNSLDSIHQTIAFSFRCSQMLAFESSIHEMLNFQTYLCSCQGSWLNITKPTTACALVSLDESSFLSTLCQQRGCLGMKGGWSLCSPRPAANLRQFGLPQRFPFAGERLLDGG